MFYGPDAHHTIDTFRVARKGESLDVGDLDGYRTMLHLDDAATAVVAALDVPAGIYNVGEDEPATRAEHLQIIAGLVGRTSLRRTFHHARKLGGSKTELLTRSQRVSSQKFKDASGWRPAYPNVRVGYPAVYAEMERAAA